MYLKYLCDIHDKRLSTIDSAAVTRWHGSIAKLHGPVQANRCLALLATMYSKASGWIGYKGVNPCLTVVALPEKDRERFLLPAEMKAFFEALATESQKWQAFFLLCLFTGSRRGNVASMEWSELDLDGSLWHIPAMKTKNGKPTTITLCEPAAAILTTRHSERNGSPYVFPAAKGSGHLSDPRPAWQRVLAAMRACPECKQTAGKGELVDHKAWRLSDRAYRCPHCKADLPPAKILDLHIHDLRRTQGSWQAAMGISLAIVGKSLGHADLKSTQVYARLQLDPVKDAVSKASGAMLSAAGVAIGNGKLLIDLSSTPIEACADSANTGNAVEVDTSC
jgi:integrase